MNIDMHVLLLIHLKAYACIRTKAAVWSGSLWRNHEISHEELPSESANKTETRVNPKLFLKDVLKKITDSTFIIEYPSTMQMCLG